MDAAAALSPDTAGRIARSLEPLHAMIYFAPEADEAYTALGLERGRMGYFASRSAAMGAVGPGPVAATFYNFNPTLVSTHLPAAWSIAQPDAVLGARYRAVDRALRRLLGEDAVASEQLREAAQLARRATEGCRPEGRALYAAHADLEWPDQPHLVLWHALSLLREHRGDGHVNALLNHGLSGQEALLTHIGTGAGFVEEFARTSRGWSEQQWQQCSQQLQHRGLLDSDNRVTEDGAALRREIENDTDRLGAAGWQHLGTREAERLGEIAGELARQAVAAGCFPQAVFQQN